VNDLQRVLPIARHGDARDDLAFTVEFGETASFVRHQLDAGDIADQYRRSLVTLHDQFLDIADTAQVALAANHVFNFGHLDDSSADVAVRVTNDLCHLHQRNAVGTQLHRIDRHLIGLHETADRGDFRDTMRLGQLVADEPVLDRAQLGECLVLG